MNLPIVSVAAVVAVIALAGAACGPSDPQPRAEPTSTTTTTALPTTTVSLAPTSIGDTILCGTELPLFPTVSINGEERVDTEGSPGPVEGADPALDDQVVRHWVIEGSVIEGSVIEGSVGEGSVGDGGSAIEIRWPAGPGPDVESPIVLTQLVDTGAASPCDVVRVSGYGDEGPLNDDFGIFVDSLDGIDALPAFLETEAERLTPAEASEPGNCEEPILTTLDEFGKPEPEAAQDLIERYAKDRTNGSGYESCFTIAGLRELERLIEIDGVPDIVRPAASLDFTAEALATYLDADPLRVIRESLRIIAVPAGGEHQLLFSGLSTGPDSNVGEDEAIAFIDEFLTLLADGDYESASGYMVNEGVSDDVIAAMPTFEDEPTEALRRFCRQAYCEATYKISDTLDFDASTRQIDVAFFTDDATIEYPMTVGAFEGQLVLLTPPPAP